MSSKDPMTFLEWIGIRKTPRYEDYMWLATVIRFLLLLLGLIFIFFVLFLLWKLGDALYFGGEGKSELVRNIGLLLVAFIGAPFVVWRAIAYQKQVNVAEQGHITDRINEAVKGLGAEKLIKTYIETSKYIIPRTAGGFFDSRTPEEIAKLEIERNPDGSPIIIREPIEKTEPNLEVRIGAIYALERIAQDSLRDHIQIMEILCAYVRENSSNYHLEPTEHLDQIAIPRIDIQTAITVIGRRSKKGMIMESGRKYRLDLTDTDLSRIDFKKGNFSAALFMRCRLECSTFDSCDLTGTQFFSSILNYATFEKSIITGTNFSNITVNRPVRNLPSFPGNIYGNGSFLNGNIKSIIITNADLSAVYQTNDDLKECSFGDLRTKLHAWQPTISKTNYTLWALDDNPIFEKNDLQQFKRKFDLQDWPYTDD